MTQTNKILIAILILLLCCVAATLLLFFVGDQLREAIYNPAESVALPVIQPELSGSLSPDNGPVIAVIDGEEFHYNHVALLFRDLLRYPEEPFTVMAGRDAGVFATYAERALALELAYRAAVDEGGADYQWHPQGFYDSLDLNSHFNNVELGGGQQIVAAVKKEYELTTTEDLVALTAPLRQKGEVAVAYIENVFRTQYGLADDDFLSIEEEDQVALYEKWLTRYDVEVIPLSAPDGETVNYMRGATRP